MVEAFFASKIASIKKAIQTFIVTHPHNRLTSADLGKDPPNRLIHADMGDVDYSAAPRIITPTEETP